MRTQWAHSAFNQVVSLLTNGVDDFVVLGAHVGLIGAGVSGGTIHPESFYLASAPGSFNGIDFAGDQIDSISLILGSDIQFVTTDSSGSLSGHATFQIDGVPVPEPETLLLCAVGVAGLVATQVHRSAHRWGGFETLASQSPREGGTPCGQH